MIESTLLILTTCPDSATANTIAESLVSEQLAACINILPTLTSVYRWKGKIEKDQETLLLIKCSKNRYSDIERRLTELHPYELPEIIAVPVEQGHPEYLHWVNQQCIKKPSQA